MMMMLEIENKNKNKLSNIFYYNILYLVQNRRRFFRTSVYQKSEGKLKE